MSDLPSPETIRDAVRATYGAIARDLQGYCAVTTDARGRAVEAVPRGECGGC